MVDAIHLLGDELLRQNLVTEVSRQRVVQLMKPLQQ